MKKKLAVAFIVALVLVSVAGAQTPFTGEVGGYADENEGGRSTVTMTEAVETIGGRQVTTYTLTGNRSAGVQYPYAGISFHFDAAAKRALAGSTGISFKIVGDGRRYGCEALLSTVTDWAHYQFEFATTRSEREVTIRWNQFQQPGNWGMRVPFDTAVLDTINFYATANGAINIKIYDLQILR